MIKTRFICDNDSKNWFQITIPENYLDDRCYYNAIISDENDTFYYDEIITNNKWFNFDVFGKVFKYNIKILKFDGDNITTFENYNFNIKNHNFNISLRSEDKNEIRIWKYYLWLIQIKYHIKFNIIENDILYDDSLSDFIEISKKSYSNYLKTCEKPITNDYSSLTIISTLFDILTDNYDIVNHPWIKDSNIIK